MDGRRDFLLEQIAIVSKDSCHSCPDVISFNERDMAHFDATDIGDRIQWSGMHDPDGDPQVTGALGILTHKGCANGTA